MTSFLLHPGCRPIPRTTIPWKARGTALCVLVLAVVLEAHARSVELGHGTRADVAVRTVKDLRDAGLIRQRWDYSCGAAALATLLRYQLGTQVSERDILTDLFALLSGKEAAQRRERGFSLLDLKHVAEARGYRAQGFRLAPRDLSKLRGPVIVYLEPRGYKHFAVLRGVKADRVYLADPARGNIRLPGYRFLESWVGADGKGIIFVVEGAGEGPPGATALSTLPAGPAQPEILTVRELLAVGSPFAALPKRAP